MTEVSTLAVYECEEEWEVYVDKQVYTLTTPQVELLKQASVDGNKRLAWFDDFAISIAHIESIKRKNRTYWRNEGGAKTMISKGEYESGVKSLCKQ